MTWRDVALRTAACDPILSSALQPARAASARAATAARLGARLVRLACGTRLAGNAPLTSAQWQARDAWSNALAKFASSGTITGAMTGAVALQTLRALLAETLWAPEAAPAPDSDPRHPGSRGVVVRLRVARGLRCAPLAPSRVAEPVPAARLAACARRDARTSGYGTHPRAAPDDAIGRARERGDRQPRRASRRCAFCDLAIVRALAQARSVGPSRIAAVVGRDPPGCTGAHRGRDRAAARRRRVHPWRRESLPKSERLSVSGVRTLSIACRCMGAVSGRTLRWGARHRAACGAEGVLGRCAGSCDARQSRRIGVGDTHRGRRCPGKIEASTGALARAAARGCERGNAPARGNVACMAR